MNTRFIRIRFAVHKLHHEDKHINVTTTNRHHPLEALLKTAVVLLPMSLFIDIPLDTAIFGISIKRSE